MNSHESGLQILEETELLRGRVPGYPRPGRPPTAEAMLRQLSAGSEEFAYGSTALAAALKERRRVVIAANMNREESGLPNLSCWQCTHDDQGIDLHPFAIDPWTGPDHSHVEWRAAQIVGNSTRGDVVVVCDPWGDSELLCWALRTASHHGVTTIAITTDQPNLLAALAVHSIRVPVTAPFRREFVITALRHLVQTAGTTLVPARQRITGPLRALNFA